MEIQFTDNLSEEEKKGIWELLCKCNFDFFPPLSSRFSTSDEFLTSEKQSNEPIAYYKSILNQQFILVKEHQKIIGFLSFITSYSNEFLKNYPSTNYVSTICIEPNLRGKGIGTLLYDFMEQQLPKNVHSNYISIRTWNQNFAQLKILDKRAYRLVHEIKNHRGEGISSLYFVKTIS